MNHTRTLLFALATLAVIAGTRAQPAAHPSGPLIHSGGAILDVPHVDFVTPLEMTYRVAFDVSRGSSPATRVNQDLDSVARFLNMQVKAGVPAAQLKLAVVVHASATVDLLANSFYRARAGEDNPNLALIDELSKAGVRVIVCGQSAASRGLTKGMFLEPVEMALSAMTAFAVLQERGYHVNPF